MYELMLFLGIGLLAYVTVGILHAYLFGFAIIRQWVIRNTGSAAKNKDYQQDQLVTRACYWLFWWVELLAQGFYYILLKIISRNSSSYPTASQIVSAYNLGKTDKPI